MSGDVGVISKKKYQSSGLLVIDEFRNMRSWDSRVILRAEKEFLFVSLRRGCSLSVVGRNGD